MSKLEELLNQLREEVKRQDMLLDAASDSILNLQNDVIKKSSLIEHLSKTKDSYTEFLSSITPVKVYHHKERKNTTVKFLDNSSVTVHLMQGDKNSLETAIAYALVKKIYPKKLIEKLVDDADIIKEGGKECKKI